MSGGDVSKVRPPLVCEKRLFMLSPFLTAIHQYAPVRCLHRSHLSRQIQHFESLCASWCGICCRSYPPGGSRLSRSRTWEASSGVIISPFIRPRLAAWRQPFPLRPLREAPTDGILSLIVQPSVQAQSSLHFTVAAIFLIRHTRSMLLSQSVLRSGSARHRFTPNAPQRTLLSALLPLCQYGQK